MKQQLFGLLILLVACSSTDQTTTMVSGTLLGYDGKPMTKSHVHFIRINQREAMNSVEVGADGSFQISTNERGMLFLQFSGVDHATHLVPLLVEKSMNVNLQCRLQRLPYHDNFDEVKIIGDFNNYSYKTALNMDKQVDGTFLAEFETAENQFKYQLLNIAGDQSVNGTMSDAYEYDGISDYRSVLNVKDGKVKIVFDPQKIIRSDNKAEVEFIGDHSQLEGLAALYNEMDDRMNSYQKAAASHSNAGRDEREFLYDWSKDLATLVTQLTNEKDPFLRQVLLFNYSQLGLYGASDLDKAIIENALDEISPTSPLYSIHPFVIQTYFRNLDTQKYEMYVAEMIAEHEDPSVKAAVLYNEFMIASMKNQNEKVMSYYDELVQNYPESPYAKLLQSRFKMDRNVSINKPVPNFSINSFDNPTLVFSNQSLKGKYYLIDFWATWCAPCIYEMDNLHEAYEKFSQKNFEILSLSLDHKPEDVRQFRKDRWEMPWLHAYIEDGFNAQITKDFEVTGIPKPILVDPDGKIIATNVELRGKNLDRTLSRILNH